jgi:hypothetical protein
VARVLKNLLLREEEEKKRRAFATNFKLVFGWLIFKHSINLDVSKPTNT